MQSSKISVCIVSFFIFLWGNPESSLFAQTDLIFRTYSPEGGFYYDGVKDIVQDKEGFIWVLMDENLYRFDGYEYKSYYYHFTKLDKSIRWTFKNFAVDCQGRMLVATENGLFQYNRQEDAFLWVSDYRTELMTVDNKNNVWVYGNRRWNILDTQKDTLFTPPIEDGSEIQRSILCFYNDNLYVFSPGNQVFQYNYVHQVFEFCFDLSLKGVHIADACIVKGKLWLLLRENEVLKVDLATSVIEERFDTPENMINKCLYVDKRGMVWIGSIKGIHILNPATKEYAFYGSSDDSRFGLPNNSIWVIKEDNQRNVWVGTFSGGLAYVNLDEETPFNTFFPQRGGLNHTPVSAFSEDEQYIWISTEGGGLNCMNKLTGEFSYYKHDSNRNSLTTNNIKSLVVDHNKRLWISTYEGGMDCLDIEKKHFRNYKKTAEKSGLLSNSLRKIVLEMDRGLWVVYQDTRQSLSYYSFEEDDFVHYSFGEQDDHYYIFDVLRGRNNRLWVLTYQKLYVMDLADYTIKNVPLDPSLYLYGRTLFQDSSGNIWIGTTGNGLIKYLPETQEYIVYNEFRDRGINTIYSILCDDDGGMWLGTDNGLLLFEAETGKILRFEKLDGLQGESYYPLSAMKAMNGELYLGGTNGFTVVAPQSIERNRQNPHVMISDFQIDHVPARIDDKEEIVLKYNQANFGFKFSSDSYLIPEKTRYRFKLHGYDNRWNEVDASNRIAYYSKIPPGNYLFEIVAANNDGVWSEESTCIKIKRKPAPWLSWPAYLFYFLLFLGILYVIHRYYLQQKKLKLQLYLETLEQEKREEIYQSQLCFFTNISHDFRTPLTLILGVLGKLKQEGVKDYYYRILYNNANRLLNLVNELMEFRTVENGKMSLHVEPLNINKLIQSLSVDFVDYARQRGMEYTVKCDPDLPVSLWVDKQIVEKIVMNLINNALKYTKDGGKICVETYADEKKYISDFSNSYIVNNELPEVKKYFLIVVRDSGVGISGESIKNVFERFYKVNTASTGLHLGTGIGLALVKSLVLLHKGKVAIHSERDKGTELVVYLPLDFKSYRVDELQASGIKESVPYFADEKEELQLSEASEVFLRNQKRVLVVEDNAELRILMTDFLSADYEVVEAEDGEVAIDVLSKMEVDLIISDVMMPNKDGITFSKEVKNNLETSHIPIILLTAKTGMENRIEGAEAGADLYFEKPIDFELLLLTINNIFGRQAKLKEYYAKNFFVDSPELSVNEQDNKFLKKVIEILDNNINQPQLDVNYIASELSMSRSKLYLKIKALTDKSIIEFILSYRLRKAARIIIEEDVTMRQVMEQIGIESQSYFTNAFKKEFGETPTAFASKYRHKE